MPAGLCNSLRAKRGLSGAAGRDVLSNFAGLGSACPGFRKTRYSASAVSTTTARTTERDLQVAMTRCAAGRGQSPALLPCGTFAIAEFSSDEHAPRPPLSSS